MINELNHNSCIDFIINSLKNSIDREKQKPLVIIPTEINSVHSQNKNSISSSNKSEIDDNLEIRYQGLANTFSNHNSEKLLNKFQLEHTSKARNEQIKDYIQKCGSEYQDLIEDQQSLASEISTVNSPKKITKLPMYRPLAEQTKIFYNKLSQEL
jgi:uncharacterized membrane-anchored protein YjiN (DUF445 family)